MVALRPSGVLLAVLRYKFLCWYVAPELRHPRVSEPQQPVYANWDRLIRHGRASRLKTP